MFKDYEQYFWMPALRPQCNARLTREDAFMLAHCVDFPLPYVNIVNIFSSMSTDIFSRSDQSFAET